jgi:nucleotide-binding universal stress UspA family protein
LVFKTILVPYDGSDMSDKALDKAVEIAKLVNNSKIIIIHVIPEIPTPIFLKEIRSSKTGARIIFSEYMESLYEQMESEIKEKLKERKEKYSKSGLDLEIYYCWKTNRQDIGIFK